MTTKLVEFIKGYEKAVIEGDINKISSHFYQQFTLSTTTEIQHITNNDTFKDNLKKTFEKYALLGAKVCRMQTIDIINFRSNHCIANVTWELINHGQEVIRQLDISYCVKNIDNEWKFIFVMDHSSLNIQ